MGQSNKQEVSESDGEHTTEGAREHKNFKTEQTNEQDTTNCDESTGETIAGDEGGHGGQDQPRTETGGAGTGSRGKQELVWCASLAEEDEPWA